MRRSARGAPRAWHRGRMDALQMPRRTHELGPAPVLLPHPPAITMHRSAARRRWLGVFAFLVLTAASLPVHVFAMFFVFVEVASPGDQATSVELIAVAFAASFAALLITGTLSQLIGGFPGRWRARVSFAAFSAIIALIVTAIAAITYF